MAPQLKQKRPPPPPTDSDEEDQQEVEPPSQQRHDHEEEEEEEDEASSEEDDEGSSEERALQPANPKPKPKPSSSSDTETDSEPDPPAPTPKDKPLTSTKSKEQTLKARKLLAKTTSSKRPAENNGTKREKKKKKVTEVDDAPVESVQAEDTKKSSLDESKKHFQRLFSEEDDIAILKGIIEFRSKTRGADPYKSAEAFHEFMKGSKSLSFAASCNQLKEKIRRMKKKFVNNSGKGRNGEGPSFSKPYEREVFELSKEVWGNGEGERGGGAINGDDGKAGKNTPKKESTGKSATKTNPKPPKPEAKAKPKSGRVETSGLALTSMITFDNVLGKYGIGEDSVRKQVELIEESKREELDGKWRELQDAELKLIAKRAELIAEQAKLMLQAK